MSRSDPVRNKFYVPLERADWASDMLFYVGAALSIAVLFVEKAAHPVLYNVVMIVFAVSVVALFGVGLVTRVYFGPRATDQRTRDFLSSAYGVKLNYVVTDGYYNNTLHEPTERLAAQVLENTHFSKAIAQEMAKTERIKFGVYVVLWLICLLVRQVSLDFILAASQAVLSEQMISKWVRLEWLRSRCEHIYNDVYALFQLRSSDNMFDARVFEAFVTYESVKANAATTLSGKIFEKKNSDLSSEWNEIKSALAIEHTP
jgi:hypothetical protein